MTNTKKLTLSAILVSLSFVLVMVSKLIPSPWAQGGSVTIGSMVPIILVSLIAGTKWGILSGFVFSLIQIMTSFYVPPATTIFHFVGVVMFDYIIAFTLLGLSNIFLKLTKNKIWSIPLCGLIVTSLRYLSHILSGILIWGAFADTNSIFIYSLIYNGSYMIPEIIITFIILSAIAPLLHNKIKI